MKQARTLNEAELKLVMAHCATRRHAARDRAIVMVSFHLGLRAKEIAALTVGDVRGDDGQIRDQFTLDRSQTKGGVTRTVYLNVSGARIPRFSNVFSGGMRVFRWNAERMVWSYKLSNGWRLQA